MKPAEEMRLRCWGVVMVREAAIEKVTDRVEVITGICFTLFDDSRRLVSPAKLGLIDQTRRLFARVVRTSGKKSARFCRFDIGSAFRFSARSRRSQRNPNAPPSPATAHSPAPSSRTPGLQSPSFQQKERRARDGHLHARRVPRDHPDPERNRAWRSCLERVRSRARSRARGRERRPRLCRADARDGSWRRARRARCRRVALRVVDQGRARHARGAKYPQSDRPERCVLLRDRTCRATQRAAPVPYPPETTRASRPRSARLTDARERRTRTHDFVEPSFSAPVVGHERDDTSSCFFLRKTNFLPRASVLYLFRADLDRRPTRPRPVR